MPSKREVLTVTVIMALFPFADKYLHRASFRAPVNGGTLSGFIFCRTTYSEAGSGPVAFCHFRNLLRLDAYLSQLRSEPD